MTKRLLLCLPAIAALLVCGCHHHAKKPKESSAIATETEKEFELRWTAKRIADLAAQGITGPAAEQQAHQEFREKFTYAAPKK